MNIIKIYFSVDKETGRKIVRASCNNGEMLVQPWDELSDEMHMILRALANPESCKIEVREKGFYEVKL